MSELNFINESILKDRYDRILQHEKELTKQDNINRVIIVIQAIMMFLLIFASQNLMDLLHVYYGSLIDISSYLFLALPYLLINAIKFVDLSKMVHDRKKYFEGPISKAFLENKLGNDIIFDVRSKVTPNSFERYGLMKYNWLVGSDSVTFKNGDKKVFIQDITVKRYSATANKDKDIFKGQFLNSSHDFKLNDEVLIRTKDYSYWDEIKDYSYRITNETFEIFSKYKEDIELIKKDNRLLNSIYKVKSNVFALKLYPNGEYVQILQTNKNLFEIESKDNFDTIKSKLEEEIGIVLEQLSIIQDIKIGAYNG